MNTNLNIVTLKIAKKLKEFNFSYWCDYYYDKEGNLHHSYDYKNWNLEEDKISAPNAFIVQQWLINEHKIDLFGCRMSNITSPMLGYTYAIFHEGSIDPITSNDPEATREYAIMKGIDYFCDNVIVNNDNNNNDNNNNDNNNNDENEK